MIPNCKMRHENGNCLPAGGFCTANKNICEALQNAYEMGQQNVIANLPSAQPVGCNGCRYDLLGDPRCVKCARSFQDHYEAERKEE